MNKKLVMYAVAGLVLVTMLYKVFSPKNLPASQEVPKEIAAVLPPETTDSAAADYSSQNTAGKANEDLIKNYTALIDKDNNDGDSYYQRALIYQRMQQYGQAINDLNQVLRIKPKSANALFNRGLMHAFRMEFDEAVADMSEAIKVKPNDPRLFNSRGLIYVEQNKLTEALADYNQALVLNPKYGKAYFNRGTVFERQQKFGEAKADYAKAIEFNQAEDDDADAAATKQRLLEAYYRRAIMELNLSDLKSALADVTYVIENDPKMAKGFKLRAAINTQLGNTAAAAEDDSTAQTLGMEKILK